MVPPLEGIRVIDLSSVVLGPYATQNLADYGAEVIKVESPEGDSTRHTGPSTEAGMGALFLGVNRGKKSVVIDLKAPAGRETMQALLRTADVFVHSIRPQKLAAIGLARQEVMRAHPRLVYVGLHGFGEDGPYGGRPAYDDIIQGMSGCAALMGLQGGEPNYFPSIIADKTCGHVATHAILAALFARERTGAGTFVEVPMFESMVAFNLVEHLYGRQFDPALDRAGYPRVLAAHRRPYRTLDGYLCVMPYTDAHWRAFFAEGGRADAAADPRFAAIGERTKHIEALYELTAEMLAGRSTEAWLETCGRLEIPAARVAGLDDLLEDPHLLATGFFQKVEDARMGTVRCAAPPVRFGQTPLPVRMAPRLGEHTEEILRELAP